MFCPKVLGKHRNVQPLNQKKELLSTLRLHQNLHNALGSERPVPSLSCLLPFSPKSIQTYTYTYEY